MSSEKPKLTPEERKYIKTYIAKSQPIVAASIVLIAVATYATYNDQVRLSGPTKAAQLTDFPAKLKFLCRFLILHGSWLLINVLYVVSFRFPTPAINPMAGNEHLTLAANKILQNSIEQSLISVFTQLSFVAMATGEQIVRWIPYLNFLFVLGRVAFLLGYPTKRAFGFFLNVVPIFGFNFFVLTKFLFEFI